MTIERLHCCDCNKPIGWMNYAGPHGWVICDECKEKEDEAERQKDRETAE